MHPNHWILSLVRDLRIAHELRNSSVVQSWNFLAIIRNPLSVFEAIGNNRNSQRANPCELVAGSPEAEAKSAQRWRTFCRIRSYGPSNFIWLSESSSETRRGELQGTGFHRRATASKPYVTRCTAKRWTRWCRPLPCGLQSSGDAFSGATDCDSLPGKTNGPVWVWQLPGATCLPALRQVSSLILKKLFGGVFVKNTADIWKSINRCWPWGKRGDADTVTFFMERSTSPTSQKLWNHFALTLSCSCSVASNRKLQPDQLPVYTLLGVKTEWWNDGICLFGCALWMLRSGGHSFDL